MSTPAISSNPARSSSSVDDGQLEVLYWSTPFAQREPVKAAANEAQDETRGRSRSRVMKILVATDAWQAASQRRRPYPRAHVGGGARNLAPSSTSSRRRVSPPCRCRPIPTSASRLRRPGRSRGRIEDSGADHVHIATEGPIGWAARALLPGARAAVHHQLSHALSRIYFRADAASRGLDLRGAAALSRARGAR